MINVFCELRCVKVNSTLYNRFTAFVSSKAVSFPVNLVSPS